MSFRKKVFVAVLMGILIALVIPLLYARLTLQDFLLEEARADAFREARLVSHLMNALNSPLERQEFLKEFATNQTQLSLFSPKGEELMESSFPQVTRNTESTEPIRPEVHTAISTGQGSDIRYSNQLRTTMLYVAMPLNDGKILRLGIPYTGLQPQISFFAETLFIVLIASIILASFVAYFLSGLLKRDLAQMMRVIEAISLGHYYRRLRFFPGKEFKLLAQAVNRMAENISEHINTMADQKEQLQSILDTMNEGVLVLDQHGDIRSSNKALRQMFPDMEKFEGKQVVEAIPAPALQKAVDEILQLPINTEENQGEYSNKENPLQLELESGRFFSIHLTRAGSSDVDLGAVAVFHDISPILRLEGVRRDFVANVSHELRTPLTAIQGYAETLADLESMPDDCRRFAEIIRKNGAYLARMVEELLALARLENADVPVQIMGMDAEEGAQAAIALCRQQFEICQVQLHVEIEKNLMIMANAQHITQVFRNLLENAARYAPKGSMVYIKAQKDPTAQGMTRFAVCDNGPGIPQADRDRFFERFYRVEKHRTQASTGLGLAICKHTVERLGGRIWVESPTKEYATAFYFTIPTALGDTNDRTA